MRALAQNFFVLMAGFQIMFFTCTLKDSIVYLPATAKTEAGFYMSREPVAVVPAANTEAVRRALLDVMDRGNVIIPTPKLGAFPPPVLPKYAGARSWAAFMRGASEWKIDERGGIYQIIPYRKDPDGGPSWVPDRKGQIDFPAGTKRDDVIDRMIAVVQEARAANKILSGFFVIAGRDPAIRLAGGQDRHRKTEVWHGCPGQARA